jgi:NAD(P)-dependent dehydrogenase (short-subunit alcohol dehydrogenase family)
MQDKIILITGATGGIGYQTALALAKMGAQVIVAGRRRESGKEAVAELRQASGNPKINLLLADLSLQSDVHALAEAFRREYPHLDVLVNNAGLATPQRQITADNVEAMFAVNVIAPFLLTHLLMDSLKAAHSARVITMTGGNLPPTLDMDNLQAERSFNGLNSYSQTKVAMMAVMYEFSEKLKGSNVTVNVCYPGQASTAMTRGVTAEMLPGFMKLLFPLFKLVTRDDGGKSAEKASRSSVYLSWSPEVEGVSGKYFNTNSKLAEWPPAALETDIRARLWSLMERLTRQSKLSDQ